MERLLPSDMQQLWRYVAGCVPAEPPVPSRYLARYGSLEIARRETRGVLGVSATTQDSDHALFVLLAFPDNSRLLMAEADRLDLDILKEATPEGFMAVPTLWRMEPREDDYNPAQLDYFFAIVPEPAAGEPRLGDRGIKELETFLQRCAHEPGPGVATPAEAYQIAVSYEASFTRAGVEQPSNS